MQVTVDTNNLTDLDRQVLALIAGKTFAEAAAAPAAKQVKKTAAPKPDPADVEFDVEVEPAAAPEDEAEDGPTLDTAIQRATELVSNGEAAKVKAALGKVGAKRVSEVSLEKVPTFLKHLG